MIYQITNSQVFLSSISISFWGDISHTFESPDITNGSTTTPQMQLQALREAGQQATLAKNAIHELTSKIATDLARKRSQAQADSQVEIESRAKAIEKLDLQSKLLLQATQNAATAYRAMFDTPLAKSQEVSDLLQVIARQRDAGASAIASASPMIQEIVYSPSINPVAEKRGLFQNALKFLNHAIKTITQLQHLLIEQDTDRSGAPPKASTKAKNIAQKHLSQITAARDIAAQHAIEFENPAKVPQKEGAQDDIQVNGVQEIDEANGMQLSDQADEIVHQSIPTEVMQESIPKSELPPELSAITKPHTSIASAPSIETISITSSTPSPQTPDRDAASSLEAILPAQPSHVTGNTRNPITISFKPFGKTGLQAIFLDRRKGVEGFYDISGNIAGVDSAMYTKDLSIKSSAEGYLDLSTFVKLSKQGKQFAPLIISEGGSEITVYEGNVAIVHEMLINGMTIENIVDTIKAPDPATPTLSQEPRFDKRRTQILQDLREAQIVNGVRRPDSQFAMQILEGLPQDLCQDLEFMKEVVMLHMGAAKFASEELRSDKDFMMHAVLHHGFAFEYASEELRNDPELARTAIRAQPEAARYISSALKNDEEFMRPLIHVDYYVLKYAPQKLRDDKLIALNAIKHVPYAVGLLSERLRGDPEIVLPAIKRDPTVIRYVSDSLKQHGESAEQFIARLEQMAQDRSTTEAAVTMDATSDTTTSLLSQEPRFDQRRTKILQDLREAQIVDGFKVRDSQAVMRILESLPKELCQDSEFMKEVVVTHMSAAKFASEELRSDKGFMMHAVRHQGLAFEYANEELRNDPELARIAIRDQPNTAEYIGSALKSDKKFMLPLIHRDYYVLKYASQELKDDKSIGLHFSKHAPPYAIALLSERLRGDPEVVLPAIKRDPAVIKYVSDSLKQRGESAEQLITRLEQLAQDRGMVEVSTTAGVVASEHAQESRTLK